MRTIALTINIILFLLIFACPAGACPPPSQPPTVTFHSYVKYSSTEDKVIFIAYASDPDGGSIVDYEWDFPTSASDIQQDWNATCSDCGTGCLDGSNCYRTNCEFTSTGKKDVKVRVKDDEGVWSAWKTATVYVANVTSVVWERYDVNHPALDSHPGTPPNTGKRIFTGYTSPDDDDDLARERVKLKVTI